MIKWLNCLRKFIVFIILVSLFSMNFVVLQNVTRVEAKTMPTITYFCTLDPKVAASYSSYSQIAAYQLLMKKLGVKIEFKHPPSSGASDQFNLMIASRQMTDIIMWNWLNYPGGPVKALQDKVILRLNSLIPKYAPNFKRYIDSKPDIRKLITTDNGDIYAIPGLKEAKENLFFYGPQIRKDWLHKLKINPPETVDEWYKMLKAFKTKDPNGNGKKDERPFTIIRGATNPRAAFDYCNFLVGAWGISTTFYQENGRVKYGPLQPQFKNFMLTLQKWWKEGLIDPDILTMNRTLIKANIQNNLTGSWIGLLSGDLGYFINLLSGKNSTFDVIGVKYPVLQKGQMPELGQTESYINAGYFAAISATCKNIPLALKILDWGYSREGYMAFNFGIEGKSYVVKNGKPVFTDEILKNPQGLDPSTALARYALSSTGGPFVQAKEVALQVSMLLPQQKVAVKNWSYVKNDKVLPPSLTFTPEESSKIANIMNTINTYYDEMFLKMMTGKVTNIDSFVKNLKKMGIDEAVKIYQNAYDRFKKRK